MAGEVEHQRPELGGLVGQPHEAEFLRYRKLTADGRLGCYFDRIAIGWLTPPGARRGDAMNRRRAAWPCHRIHDGAPISGGVPRLPAYFCGLYVGQAGNRQ